MSKNLRFAFDCTTHTGNVSSLPQRLEVSGLNERVTEIYYNYNKFQTDIRLTFESPFKPSGYDRERRDRRSRKLDEDVKVIKML